MRRVCAWCTKTMGRVHSNSFPERVITHRICDKCADILLAKLGIPLTVFLDSLAAPVVVVDDTVRVKTANRHAQTLLQKNLSMIEGYKGGDVFMCAYATLPDCRRSSMRIRSAVQVPSFGSLLVHGKRST